MAKLDRPEKIEYLDHFRAVAIILIISGHTYPIAFVEDPRLAVQPLNVVLALITGGTAYFVFISGFLYRHVFYGRVNYQKFMTNKFRNVVLPYLLLGTPLALAAAHLSPWEVVVQRFGEPLPPSLFSDVVFFLTTGRMITAYWYIPFIVIVFALSPLFDVLIRARLGLQVAVLVLLIVLASLVHRSIFNADPIQNLFYFLHYYVAGMICAQQRVAFTTFIARPAVVALAGLALVGVAVVQAYVLQDPGNVAHTPFVARIDLMIVQKYVGIVVFCGLLHLVGRHARSTLTFVASISFGLFFLHPIVITGLRMTFGQALPHTGMAALDLLVYSAVVTGTSIAAVQVVKAVLGERSRLLVGS
jgi:probable poly-beta-1,6-N-acetyl-D-glucosamine export protein